MINDQLQRTALMEYKWKQILPDAKALIINMGVNPSQRDVVKVLMEKFEPEVIKFNDFKIMKLRENIRRGHGTKGMLGTAPPPSQQGKKRLTKLSEKEEKKNGREETVQSTLNGMEMMMTFENSNVDFGGKLGQYKWETEQRYQIGEVDLQLLNRENSRLGGQDYEILGTTTVQQSEYEFEAILLPASVQEEQLHNEISNSSLVVKQQKSQKIWSRQVPSQKMKKSINQLQEEEKSDIKSAVSPPNESKNPAFNETKWYTLNSEDLFNKRDFMKLGKTKSSASTSEIDLVDKLAKKILPKNGHLLADIAGITFDGEHPTDSLQDHLLDNVFNDGVIIGFIVRGKFDKDPPKNQIATICEGLRAAGSAAFDGKHGVKPKGNHNFKYSLQNGLIFKEVQTNGPEAKFKRTLKQKFSNEQYRNHVKTVFNWGGMTEMDFHVIKIKFRTCNDESVQQFIQGMNHLVQTNALLFQDAFVIDIDFTIDLKIGFHPDVMWQYFIDQERKFQKEQRYDESCSESDNEEDDKFNSKGNHNIWRLGKYCIKRNHGSYEAKYYNKFMYFLMLGSEINKSVGCSLSRWCKNESPQLADKIRQSMDFGFTRIELRFEHLQFMEAGYYLSEIQNAIDEFQRSKSARIQPIPYQWKIICGHIQNTLVMTHNDSRQTLIAWARDSMQNKICGIVFNKTDKGQVNPIEYDTEHVCMLAVNNFMPNNCNINIIDAILQNRNQFIRLKVRAFKKLGNEPTCLFDQGFFADYRKLDPMLPQQMGLIKTDNFNPQFLQQKLQTNTHCPEHAKQEPSKTLKGFTSYQNLSLDDKKTKLKRKAKQRILGKKKRVFSHAEADFQMRHVTNKELRVEIIDYIESAGFDKNTINKDELFKSMCLDCNDIEFDGVQFDKCIDWLVLRQKIALAKNSLIQKRRQIESSDNSDDENIYKEEQNINLISEPLEQIIQSDIDKVKQQILLIMVCKNSEYAMQKSEILRQLDLKDKYTSGIVESAFLQLVSDNTILSINKGVSYQICLDNFLPNAKMQKEVIFKVLQESGLSKKKDLCFQAAVELLAKNQFLDMNIFEYVCVFQIHQFYRASFTQEQDKQNSEAQREGVIKQGRGRDLLKEFVNRFLNE